MYVFGSVRFVTFSVRLIDFGSVQRASCFIHEGPGPVRFEPVSKKNVPNRFGPKPVWVKTGFGRNRFWSKPVLVETGLGHLFVETGVG